MATTDERDDDTLPLFEFGPPARLGETAEPVDLPRLATNTVRVIALLADGHAHTIEELRRMGGSSGDRRARDLRDKRWGSLPLDVWADPAHGRGFWLYRLDLGKCTARQLDVLKRATALFPHLDPAP